MNWTDTDKELPKLYAPVLADWMGTTFLTPDGWDGGIPPKQWAYVYDAIRDESQQSISEWGTHTFGQVKDPAVLVGRCFEEFVELLQLLLPEDTHKKLEQVSDSIRARLRTPSAVLPAAANIEGQAADEMADVLVVLYQAAEAFGVDLLGAADQKMVTNRARKWAVTEAGTGQHQD